MYNEFKIDELVVHVGVPGKKFKIVGKTITHYEVQNLETDEVLLEPINCILDLIESRDNLIKFILD